MKRTSLICVTMLLISAGHLAASEDTNATSAGPSRGLVSFAGEAPEAVAAAVILPVAVPTILLDVSDVDTTISVPSTVTYHPGFDTYYASATGNPNYAGFVFGSAGGAPIHVEEPLNIDVRAWNYNANTNLLEVVTYDAVTGGAGRGLIEAQTDGSGLLTGGTASLLAAMPGNNGSQTAPAYNATANVFYSRDDNNVVNRVSRIDGSLLGTINLDFVSAGITSAPDDGIVYVPEIDALGVLDESAETLSLFDGSGAFLANVSLPLDVGGSSRRPGYANGQLFVWDSTLDGWQGLRILDDVSSITAIPTASTVGLVVFGLLLLVVSLLLLGRRRAMS